MGAHPSPSQTRRTLSLLLAGLLSVAALPGRASGQQVRAEFIIHLETLPLRQQEDLREFNRQLKDYVEGHDWLDQPLPNPVRVQLEAFLAYLSSRIKTQYGSKLTASNGTDIKYLDRWWFFEFEHGDVLRHDEHRFHPLTWLIDYYVHLMIGHTLDEYSLFGGNEHFQRAHTIATDGRFSPEYQRGWDERLQRVQDILSDDYKPYRQLRATFYQGIRLHKEGNNYEAKRFCAQAIDSLASFLKTKPRDERPKEFLDAHYLELADVFKTETTPDVYQLLIEIDPAHRATYDQCIANLGRK
ncbi:MAG: DUF4835 family protein [Candidatus Latescibacteria bacterium]|nr:DUF4835 family protein [Candidatus Latescibacterota bacterium]